MKPMTEEQKARFDKLLPLRVILRISEDGEHVEGLIENSFSMDWSKDRVLLLWSGAAHSNIGTTHTIEAQQDAEALCQGPLCKDALILDPLDPECPIDVDFEFWMRAKNKFNFRNPPFKAKVVQHAR